MKKIMFFIPVIIISAFYGWILIGAGFSISPIVYAWIGLFLISGILLSKGLFWGGFFGMLPGIYMMYMSMIDTGQIINIEFPMGIIISVFYLFCCGIVFHKRKKISDKN